MFQGKSETLQVPLGKIGMVRQTLSRPVHVHEDQVYESLLVKAKKTVDELDLSQLNERCVRKARVDFTNDEWKNVTAKRTFVPKFLFLVVLGRYKKLMSNF